jgi:hypothetical protein
MSSQLFCNVENSSNKDWETSQDRGNDDRRKLDILDGKTAQDLRLERRYTFQQADDPKHTANTSQEWLRVKSLNVTEWPRQSLDLNPIQHLWRDLKMAVQQRSPSNLTWLQGLQR